ncbi:MAG: hypothetical protein GYB49_04765 [Alphaproteobacteria bacterium]|nr:hypothetical protein [Hyphomonas sp.]MBR9806518.1 hypothetical protein [Alphaproteobacteria bacterium]|tara:strand:+ start:3206 stop:3745 length:540 start_codon:yes stop_codon:yes gene_type:complete
MSPISRNILVTLLIGSALSGCSNEADAASGSEFIAENIQGVWACEMENERDGATLSMVGHTTYSPTGSYEATGLGVVYFETPFDQIRWVATSSGSFQVSDDKLTITTKKVEAQRLFPIGLSGVEAETVAQIENDLISPINNSNEQTSDYTITRLDTDRLDTINTDGTAWKCRKKSEANK